MTMCPISHEKLSSCPYSSLVVIGATDTKTNLSNNEMKNIIFKLIKEFVRAGFAATLAALGLSASGCASAPVFFF